MNLWNKLRERFAPKAPTKDLRPRFAPPPSAMRNKPGGLAWIRVPTARDGSEVLDRRVVTTVRTDEAGFWLIDPPQQFVLRDFALTGNGRVACPGELAEVASMHDDLLEPIPQVPEGAVDEMVAKLGAAPKSPGVPVLNQRHAEDFAKAAAEHYRNNPPVGEMAGQGV